MEQKTVRVGMADLNVVNQPDKITTLGLGSCVGVVIYDKYKKVAGLLHAMLPSSKDISNNSNKAKFVDTGIDELLRLMQEKGASKNLLVAKIAGGAQMFDFNSSNDVLRIGDRNVEATKEKLKSLNIRLIAEDTGGNFGRTIVFDTNDGSLYIRTIGHGEKTI